MSKFQLTDEDKEKLKEYSPDWCLNLDAPTPLLQALCKLHGQWRQDNVLPGPEWSPTIGEPVVEAHGAVAVVLDIVDTDYDYFEYIIFSKGAVPYIVVIEELSQWPDDKEIPEWMKPLTYDWLMNSGAKTSGVATAPSETDAEVANPLKAQERRLPKIGDRIRWTKPMAPDLALKPYRGLAFTVSDTAYENGSVYVWPEADIWAKVDIWADDPIRLLDYERNLDSWEFVDEESESEVS